MLESEGLGTVTVYGEALVTAGLEAYGAISGLGLVTRGLIWECPNIWVESDSTITTNWAAESSLVTSWTSSDSAITTVWTPSSGDPFAEC